MRLEGESWEAWRERLWPTAGTLLMPELRAELVATRDLLRDSAERSAALETALADLIRVCSSSPSEGRIINEAVPAAEAVYRGLTPEPEKRS